MNEFHCEQCGSCFTRQEHLARHARTHTKEKPHLCFECGKSFSRRDALLRHSASHASAARVTSAFSRACRQCAASRARCTRDQPCGRCSDKGLFCDYPPSRRKRGNSSCAQPSNGLQGALDTPGRSEGVGVSDDPWSTLTPVAGQETLEQVPGCWPVTNDFAFSQVHAVQSATCGVMQPLAMSAMNWLPPESSMPPNWEAWQAGISNGRPSNDMGPPSSMPAHLVDNAQNGQPWREPEGDSGVDVSGRIATMPTSAGTDRDSPSGPSSPQSVQSEGAPSAGDATLYVDGASTRLPFKGRCAESHTKERNVEQAASVVSSEDESELPSPWSQPVNTPSAASKPRDRSVLTGHLSAEAFSHLVLQLQSRSSAEIDVSEGRLPMLRYMRAFLRLYFRHFHPAWPFLPPDLTYYEEPTRWILLLAVTAVGSRYTTGGQCVRYSELLCDVLGRSTPLLLDEMQQNLPADDTSVRKTSGTPRKEDALAVLQAAVLDIASKCHDSRFASPTAAFAQIFATVDLCRSTGLLKTMQSSSVEGSGVSVLDEWMWRQLRIRTGLMIWALDSMISFEFCRNPLFRLDDAAVSLPCRASLWEHPTYDGVETSDKHSVTIPKAMEILYMEKGLPPNTDNLGTNILIFAICRRTREAFQHYQTPLASWVPTARVRRESSTYANHTKVEECWPPSLPILSKWRNSACDCLDILHWNANGTVAKAGGWEHPAVLNLHLSRLLILAPTQDLQRMAASISSENCSSEGSEIGRRANLIFQWACKDQHKARLSVIHAGALLWHIRRYCVGSFLEPFAAFAATLVIWAYSSGRQQKKPHLSDSRDPRRMEEDSDTIFLHLDRPLDDELVQEFVVSGDKMAGHLAGVGDIRSEGAPGKILKMGMGVLTDVKLGRHFARDEEPVGDDWPGVWGIEQVYIDRLERLMEIS